MLLVNILIFRCFKYYLWCYVLIIFPGISHYYFWNAIRIYEGPEYFIVLPPKRSYVKAQFTSEPTAAALIRRLYRQHTTGTVLLL
jgi:hypothetical protein